MEKKFKMAKEILEAKDVVAQTIKKFEKPPFEVDKSKLIFVACGTAYHTCLVARQFLMERGVAVQCEVASEFNLTPQIFNSSNIFVFVSQSGETTDTLGALEIVKRKGCKTIGIVNVAGSTLAGKVDHAIITQAGVEQAVAATKSFCAQIAALAMLCEADVQGIDYAIAKILLYTPDKKTVQKIACSGNVCFMGIGTGLVLAHEANLKLRETTQLNTIAIGTGEVRHGTISIINQNSVAILFVLARDHIKKTQATIDELARLKAHVVVVSELDKKTFKNFNSYIKLEPAPSLICAASYIIPLQKLALAVSIKKGCNPDAPPALTKAVTT